jgi:hypothetical protein
VTIQREPEKCAECDREPIGVEIRGLYDGVAFWQCGAGHRWHRFGEGAKIRRRVEELWARWDAVDPSKAAS